MATRGEFLGPPSVVLLPSLRLRQVTFAMLSAALALWLQYSHPPRLCAHSLFSFLGIFPSGFLVQPVTCYDLPLFGS